MEGILVGKTINIGKNNSTNLNILVKGELIDKDLLEIVYLKFGDTQTDTQQLKAEIGSIVNDYSGPLTGEDAYEIVDRLKRLSAI